MRRILSAPLRKNEDQNCGDTALSINPDGSGNLGPNTVAVTNGTVLYFIDETGNLPALVQIFESKRYPTCVRRRPQDGGADGEKPTCPIC